MTELGEWGYMRSSDAAFAWLKQLVCDPTKTIICHNMKFELEMLCVMGIDMLELMDVGARFECTMIMSKVLNSTGLDHDLEYCGRKYLNRNTQDKTDIKHWLNAENTRKKVRERGRELNFSDVPDDIVKRRVLWDVETTLGLFFFFRNRVRETCEQLYQTEHDLCYVCVDMELHGVRVDITRAEELREEALQMIDLIKQDIDRLVGSITLTKKRKKKRKKQGVVISTEIVEKQIIVESINPGSNSHLEKAWEKLGIELKYKTKPKKDKKTGEMKGGGKWAFDEYAMIRYVSKPLVPIMRESSEDGWPHDKWYQAIHDTIKKHKLRPFDLLPPLVLKHRELSKMVSTYYDHIINDARNIEIAPDGRRYGILYCKFNQSEAMTGRFSSSEINLQNIPRILGPRECFVTRKGRLNWHLDFSQVEMRFFVHFARDSKMAAYIDKDIHLYVATQIYNLPPEKVTKEQRKRAKGTGFGILYGSGADTQAETLTKKGLPTTRAEALMVVSNYHRKFPSIRKCTNQLKIDLARQGCVINPFGRRYYIRSKFAYKALNYMCQGTSADLMKAGMVRIWKWLRKEGYWPKVRIIMTVHDELVIECPPSLSAEIIPKCIAMMEDRTSFFVPITVDAEVVKTRWSEKQDPEELGFKFAV